MNDKKVILDPVIPLCLYNNNDNTNPRSILKLPYTDNSGKLNCPEKKNWVLNVLYVFNYETLPAMPRGCTGIYIRNDKNRNVDILGTVFDPYVYNPSTSDESTSKFITYYNKVQNTIPLYIYHNQRFTPNHYYYVSLSSNPPNSNFVEAQFSPLFVMKEKVSKFTCIEAICVPANPNQNKIMDYETCMQMCALEQVQDKGHFSIDPKIGWKYFQNEINKYKNYNKLTKSVAKNNKNNKILIKSHVFLLYLLLIINMVLMFLIIYY